MKHGHFSRNYAKAFFALAALAVLSACAEKSTVAPAEQATEIVAPANFVRVGHSVVFRVNNNDGALRKIGGHMLYIPAGAICALNSTYGSGEWDKPCAPMTGSITITATELRDAEDRPYIDFQPAMRFVPTKDVMLFFRYGRGGLDGQPVVKYCNAVAYCYDESLTDPSLKPYRLDDRSIIARRLKHFSGYVIGSGECSNGLSGTCEETASLRRSGYMVASGEDIVDIMNQAGKQKDEQ